MPVTPRYCKELLDAAQSKTSHPHLYSSCIQSARFTRLKLLVAFFSLAFNKKSLKLLSNSYTFSVAHLPSYYPPST